MKLIEDCWGEVNAAECNFGAHLFQNSAASIYVQSGLDVSNKIIGEFSHEGPKGFVGHCVLIFKGVKRFNFSVHPYTEVNSETVWGVPIIINYIGDATEMLQTFHLGGSLCGLSVSVAIEIEAQKFELQILDRSPSDQLLVRDSS